MKERWPYAVLSLVGLTAAAVLIVWVFGPREPVYQSQPLSYWLDQLSSPGPNQENAKLAFGDADSKGVTFLLEKIRQGGGDRRRSNSNPWSKLPPALQSYMPVPEVPSNVGEQNIPYAL